MSSSIWSKLLPKQYYIFAVNGFFLQAPKGMNSFRDEWGRRNIMKLCKKKRPNHFHLNLSLLKVKLYPRQEAQFFEQCRPSKSQWFPVPVMFMCGLSDLSERLFIGFGLILDLIWDLQGLQHLARQLTQFTVHVSFLLALPKVGLIQNSRLKTVFLRHPLWFKWFQLLLFG